MVLEPGQQRQVERGRLDHELTDLTSALWSRAALDEPEPRLLRAVVAGEGLAEDLKSGAHCEHDRTVGHRARETELDETSSCERLRRILAATEHIEITVARQRVLDTDAHDVRGQSPPPQPLGEDDCVAAVAIRAEELGEHERDARHSSRPNERTASANAV